MTAGGCLACARGVPKLGRRRCPECAHVFRGDGWDGVEAHWRARHEAVQPYDAFWSSLCRRHRARSVLGCACCAKGIAFEAPRQCPECAQVFRGRGWEGLDAHWRAQHPDVLPYEDLVATLCPGHRGEPDPAAGFLRFD